MLKVKPIGPNVGGYYLRQGPGRWAGAGAGDLGLGGAVERAELRAVLAGRHPVSGEFLPAVRSVRRRSGWDLVFAAPKSLSLLAATRTALTDCVEAAHRAAVSEALAHFEHSHLHVRTAGCRVPAAGAVAATFDHPANAGGEPHLHSHLLLMNLGRDPSGRWSSIAGWWLERRELGAVYAMGLRHHLDARGLELEWRTRADGLTDVAGVPRDAVRAISSRSRDAMRGERYSGRVLDASRPWRQRASSAGWNSETVVSHSGAAAGGHDLDASVTTRLALRGSVFGRRDVLLALGECPDARFTAEQARDWVDRFVSTCTAVNAGAVPKWTSRLAESSDRRLEAMIAERMRRAFPEISIPEADVRRTPHDHRRTGAGVLAGGPVVVLSCEPRRSSFLSHTSVAEECAALCASAGMTVAVSTRAPLDALRWMTLTGIDGFRASLRPDILFVDQADRRTSAELSVLLGAAGAARVVLVEGGTCVRSQNPSSLVVSGLREKLPCLAPDERAATWRVGLGDPAHPATGMLRCWADRMAGQPAVPTMLVALGVPEVEALNDAARHHVGGLGLLGGPELVVGGRGYRSGDTVVTIRPLRSGLAAGTLGTVLAVDPGASSAVIRWPRGPATVDGPSLARVGHGYAVTPRLASRCEVPLLVLGPSGGLGLERNRVVEAFSARGVECGMRRLQRDGPHGPETWPVHR